MEFWQRVVTNPGWWSFFLIVVGGLYYLVAKEKILDKLFHRAATRNQIETEQDRAADNERRQAIDRMVAVQDKQNTAWMELYKTERIERVSANERMYESIRMTRDMVDEAMRAMITFQEISQLTLSSREEQDAEYLKLFAQVTNAIRESTKVNGATAFVLVRLFFKEKNGGKTFQDLVNEMEETGEPVHIQQEE